MSFLCLLIIAFGSIGYVVYYSFGNEVVPRRKYTVKQWNAISHMLNVVGKVKYRSNSVSNTSLSFVEKKRNVNSTLQYLRNTTLSVNSIHSNSYVLLERKNKWVDYSFAERLRLAQKSDAYALVNDIVVIKHKRCAVYVILNNGNVRSRCLNFNVKVSLMIGKRRYKNLLRAAPEGEIRLLKYIVHDMPESGYLSLVDSSTSHKYVDLPYRMIYLPRKKKGVAVCAYISSFNSIAEIKHWIAFYLLQHVDNVILYCAEPIDYFERELRKSIESGFLILYHFPWPLSRIYGVPQKSVQWSQINSCYYRHRAFYEYIISQDVDEYVYSEKYPFDLYRAIREAFVLKPRFDALQVPSFFYIGNANREESLRNGTLFNNFITRMNNRKTKRPKQVISTNGEGWYSIHWCYFCKLGKAPLNLLRVAHFKAKVFDVAATKETHNLELYSPKIMLTLPFV